MPVDALVIGAAEGVRELVLKTLGDDVEPGALWLDWELTDGGVRHVWLARRAGGAWTAIDCIEYRGIVF